MLKKNTHFHFVGIGGIGMSALAYLLAKQGHIISGCDSTLTQKSISQLLAVGCIIHPGNNHPLCADSSINVLVHTSDVPSNHPELVNARKQGITIITRGKLLAELTRTKYTIGIAGSHGKTTTTSLTAHIFLKTEQDPTVLVGGYLSTIQSNVHVGSSNIVITETDESDRSLIHLYPSMAVLTTIDREHLNTYKNLHDVAETFRIFLEKIPFYGKAIVCIDDIMVSSLLPLSQVATITYGSTCNADYYYTNLTLHADHATYTLVKQGQSLGHVVLPIAGKHNVLNSIAALITALEANISFKDAVQALATFAGVDRRFSFRGTFQGAEVFDDYGHHPTEIACTVQVARNRTKNKVILVLQPHRYSRVSTLWKEFVELLATLPVDHLIVTDLYAAQEQPVAGVSSKELIDEARTHNPQTTITYVPFDSSFSSLVQTLRSVTTEGDLILLQGAGNITQLSSYLIK